MSERSTQRTCRCACHNTDRASYNGAAQINDWPAVLKLARVETVNTVVPVPTDDALEAAVACDACRNAHCTALLSRYVPDPDAYVDPPRPADACGDGEGQG